MNTVYAQAPDYAWVKQSYTQQQQNNFNAAGNAVATDNQGNSYISGCFKGTTTFGNFTFTAQGGSDIFLAKYDPQGNVLWAKQAGNIINNTNFLRPDAGNAIAVDSAGNVYLSGSFVGTAHFDGVAISSHGSIDAFLVKYDTNGNALWARHGGTNNGDDNALGLCLDNQGNCYITGTYWNAAANFDGIILPSLLGNNVFIAKYDSAGNILWAKGFGGSRNQIAYAIGADAQGACYVTGSFEFGINFGPVWYTGTANGSWDFFIAKFDATGNFVWGKMAQGNGADIGRGIVVNQVGQSFVTGFFETEITFDGITLPSNGGLDIFLAKYDTDGNVLWTKNAGGLNNDWGFAIAKDSLDNCFLTGSFRDTAYFGTTSISVVGDQDIFIAKFDSAGNALWAKQAGGVGVDDNTGYGIAALNSGESFVTGVFRKETRFGSTVLTAAQWQQEAFVAKLTADNLIVTDSLATAVLCPGDSVSIPFTAAGSFANGNIFTAQLSDNNGTFSAPVVIGSLIGTSSGTIQAVIPAATVPGSGYRIRVVSSNQLALGTDNGLDLTVNPLPSISISPATNPICQGAPLLLSAGGATTYSWWAGEGLPAQTGNVVTAVPANAGAVTYTVTGFGTCSNSASVTVNVNPKATGAISGSVSVCPSVQEVSYWFSGASGTNALTWGITGGTVAQQFGTDSITVNWGLSNPNAYVWAIPKNQFGCLGDTTKLPVQVNVLLVTPTPVGLVSLCADPAITQTYSTFHTNNSSYNWGISGGQIINGNGSSQIQVQWQQPGQGQLWVLQQSITATDTCFGLSDTLLVQLLPIPDSTLLIQGNAQICAGYTGNYSLAGAATSAYQWQAPGGQILGGQGTGTVEILWPIAGNFSVSVTETNSNGCVGRQIGQPVQVNPVPATTMSRAPAGVCPGSETNLSYSVLGLSGSSYNWQVAGGEIQSGQGGNSVSVSWNLETSDQSLTVTETSAFGCAGTEIAFPVMVDLTQLGLLTVSVDTANESRVLVRYQVSDSANFPQAGIEIQRQQNGSFVSAGTSGIAYSTFIDAGLPTGQQAFYYRLQGQNLCADELLSTEHATIWLSGQANAQTGLVQLSWTPYIGWENQPVQYQIWRKLDSQESYRLLPDLTTAATSAQAILGPDGFTQCFRIVALAPDTRQSFSNSICFTFENPLVAPNIITPNSDGKNDFLIIDKLHLYPNSGLTIMNRWGKEVYKSHNYQNNWRADELPAGLYFYQLQAPGQPLLKGWVEVLK